MSFQQYRARRVGILLAGAASAFIKTAAAAVPVQAIDGRPVTPRPLDIVTTPTGTWPVHDLGAVAGGHAYAFRYEGKPEWWSLCIVRYATGAAEIDDRPYRARLGGRDIVLTALPGSMKCADNGEPVPASAARLRDAVAAGRVVPYSTAAFRGWPRQPKLSPPTLPGADAGYKADRIYWRGSGYDKVFGNVSGSAGEAASSRGFLSEDDAVMIAAALDGNDSLFRRAAERNRVQMLYGLSLPNLVVWSKSHLLRDPQLPLRGDRPYANEGREAGRDQYGDEGTWRVPQDYPYLAEIEAEAGKSYGHRRDQAHQFNHGFAYWLATGDPRAALLQQAIMAYALAANYQRYPGRYRIRFVHQRTTLNQFNAMWKLHDVAQYATSANGRVLWPRARTAKMETDLWADWNRGIAALAKAADAKSRAATIARTIDDPYRGGYSNFMVQAYGPEAAYLFARAGRPELLRRIAEHLTIRLGGTGGAAGIDAGKTDSGQPLLAEGALPYRNAVELAAWWQAKSPDKSTANFDGASAHYTLRAYWALRMAKDAVSRGWMADVPGLDTAIKRTDAARDATAKWRYANAIRWKHAAVPFGTK
jgi:hypothetical protein